MRIRIDTIEEETRRLTSRTMESAGQIYIDLDPDRKTHRRGPGEGNGLLGPQLLVQFEAAGPYIVGIRVVPEPGRDDKEFMDSIDIPKNRIV